MRRIVAPFERHKILTMFIPVGLLMVLVRILPADEVQLWAIYATLPFALLFIAGYLPEHPGRSWFGSSLLVLAISVVSVAVAAALVRMFGPHEWYQNLVNVWLGLMFSALVGRTWVLLADQWAFRRHLGGQMRRLFNR